MTIIEYHNRFRKEANLPELIENDILIYHAHRASKWMARRNWMVYWNFDSTRQIILAQGFQTVDYNVAVGDEEESIIKHFLNDKDKRSRIYDDFLYIGYGVYDTKYRYWTILYAK